jgi:thioredoxin 1
MDSNTLYKIRGLTYIPIWGVKEKGDSMSTPKPINITDSQFDEKVLKAGGISVVDFWAPWCGPCISMAPALEAFTEENVEKVRVFKLDVDDNPKTTEKYNIRSIPTIIFFKDGEPVDISAGTLSKSALYDKLDNLLKSK